MPKIQQNVEGSIADILSPEAFANLSKKLSRFNVKGGLPITTAEQVVDEMIPIIAAELDGMDGKKDGIISREAVLKKIAKTSISALPAITRNQNNMLLEGLGGLFEQILREETKRFGNKDFDPHLIKREYFADLAKINVLKHVLLELDENHNKRIEAPELKYHERPFVPPKQKNGNQK